MPVVKSDAELAENSDFSQLEIKSRAEQVLSEIEAENESENESVDAYNRRGFKILFDKFDTTENVRSCCAIIHLLKNGGKV
ncbi:hypothetical protein AB3R30_04725 [Leptolyngbyaceae cyanobacterium UHCC 1019]